MYINKLEYYKISDINIILDFVINHSSNESDWFIKSSNKDEYYSDWYIWENGHLLPSGQRSPPNNWVRPEKSKTQVSRASKEHQVNRLWRSRILRYMLHWSNLSSLNMDEVASSIFKERTCLENKKRIVFCLENKLSFLQISVFRKSAWTYSANRDQFYFHQFSEAQPDFNYRNPVVVDEMKVWIIFRSLQ